MSNNKLLKDDLLDQLWNQLIKIIEFTKIYDIGIEIITQDIAFKISVLFHSENNFKSLLSQLKMEHIQFIDTCTPYDPLKIPHAGLTKIKIDQTNPGKVIGSYIPSLIPENIKLINFETWWNINKVIIDKNKNAYTRKELIIELSETEIQSPEVVKLYSTNWIYTDDKGITHHLKNPLYPSIRQIAYETLSTFARINIPEESKL